MAPGRARFEDLAPTLLCQLLMLQEGLDPPMARIRGRLAVNGVLTYRGGDAAIDAVVDRDLRQRVRSAALEQRQPLDAGVGHLVALRSIDEDWLEQDIGADRARCRLADSQADALREDFPVAQAARDIVRGYQAMLDWYDWGG